MDGNQIPANVAAQLIANNDEARAAFMIHNNAAQLNVLLRKLGYDMDFEPNPKQLVATLQIIIDTQAAADWEYLERNFTINPNNIDPELSQELKQYFSF